MSRAAAAAALANLPLAAPAHSTAGAAIWALLVQDGPADEPADADRDRG